MAIAWATVVFVVLLLPGIVFSAGLVSSSRFSRDAMPQTAVAQLAGIVLASFAIHTLLLYFVADRVDFHVLLSALQAGEAGALRVDQLAANLKSHWRQVVRYVAVALGLSFGLGRLAGWMAVRWKLRLFVQHDWIYEIDQRPRSRKGDATASMPVVRVFVLTKTGHDGRQLLYEGYLRQFNLRQDGSFAYLLLKQPKKCVLDLSQEALTPTEITVRPPAGSLSPENVDPSAFLHLAGEEIRNVVFRKEIFISSSKEDRERLDQALKAWRQAAATAREKSEPPAPPPKPPAASDEE